MNVAINMTADGLALSSHHVSMHAGNQFPIQGDISLRNFSSYFEFTLL